MDIVWGLFLYSLVNGMGFDVSHSITNLGTQFFSKNECGITVDFMGWIFIFKDSKSQSNTLFVSTFSKSDIL